MGNIGNSFQVQVVKGGFILTTFGRDGSGETEVFNSPGKLVKAIRGLVEGDKPETKEAEG